MFNRAMFDQCIILAGGAGTRLWPASTSKTPKQFLDAGDGGTFFSAALDRALAVLGDRGRIIIIAGETHGEHVIRECTARAESVRGRILLIIEPLAKNTAAAIASGVLWGELCTGENQSTLVLTSDHVIRDTEAFTRNAAAAGACIREEGLAVFGIPPRSPETGYGYIETGESLRLPPEERGSRAFPAISFREKPGRSQAESYLAAGNFYWNSGMFAFSSRFILEEFRRSAANVLRPFLVLKAPGDSEYSLKSGVRLLPAWKGLDRAYTGAEGISFDYAIAEKCRKTVMIAADFDWLDAGSWDEYASLAAGSLQKAETYVSAAENCFIDSDIPVALCGVEDLIVVIRSGKDGSIPSALVAKRGQTQRVRDIVEQIRAAGKEALL